MNAVVLTVKATYVASTKYTRLQVGSVRARRACVCVCVCVCVRDSALSLPSLSLSLLSQNGSLGFICILRLDDIVKIIFSPLVPIDVEHDPTMKFRCGTLESRETKKNRRKHC